MFSLLHDCNLKKDLKPSSFPYINLALSWHYNEIVTCKIFHTNEPKF